MPLPLKKFATGLDFKLKFVPVLALSQVEIMREIYNSCLDGLSTKEKLKPKTFEEQEIWWNNLDHFRTTCWLAYSKDPYQIVGFVMLTNRDYFFTPVFGILPEQQGKGYAREFIRFYIGLSLDKPLAGSQLQSNKAICKLNYEAGWQIIACKNGVDLLFRHNQGEWNPNFVDNARLILSVMKYHDIEEGDLLLTSI